MFAHGYLLRINIKLVFAWTLFISLRHFYGHERAGKTTQVQRIASAKCLFFAVLSMKILVAGLCIKPFLRTIVLPQ